MKPLTVILALLIAATTSRYASAAIVTFDYQVRVTAILENSSLTPIAIGDLLTGRMVFGTDVIDTFPPDHTAFYHFSSPDFWISADLNGMHVEKAIDLVSVINDRLLPNGRYLDRFFINAGDITVAAHDGIQFLLDSPQQLTPSVLMTSVEVPTAPPDLDNAAIKLYILRLPGIDIAGEFVSLSTPEPPAVVPEPGSGLIWLGVLSLAFTLRRRKAPFFAGR